MAACSVMATCRPFPSRRMIRSDSSPLCSGHVPSVNADGAKRHKMRHRAIRRHRSHVTARRFHAPPCHIATSPLVLNSRQPSLARMAVSWARLGAAVSMSRWMKAFFWRGLWPGAASGPAWPWSPDGISADNMAVRGSHAWKRELRWACDGMDGSWERSCAGWMCDRATTS